MCRRCMMLVPVTLIALSLAGSAQAQSMSRTSPAASTAVILQNQMLEFQIHVGGMIWPWCWHQVNWYVDGSLLLTHNLGDVQSANSTFSWAGHAVGAHEVKVRAKYDNTVGVHVWSDFITWTVTVVSPDTYTVTRTEAEQRTVSVHGLVPCTVTFGGLASQATWQQAEWYVDGVLYGTHTLTEGWAGYLDYVYLTLGIGTHEVKVRGKWSLNGAEVWTNDTTWTIEVVAHPPTASRVSPGSPVTISPGGTQAFTARGTDVGEIEHRLEIAGVRWYLDGVLQSTVATGNIWASTVDNTWSHTFATEGTYQVEAVFYDYEGYTSPAGQALWTVTVPKQEHAPSGTIVSPSSPATVNEGVPVSFTLQGTDPAGDLWLCEVSLNGASPVYAYFSGSTTGSTAVWTHTFSTPGTYRVAFAPLDAAYNYGTEKVWTVTVKADPGQAGLTGLVIGLDAQGRAQGPVVGAEVDLKGPGATTIATTNGQGKFAFTALKPGTYTVNVSKTGYYTSGRDISLAAGETKDDVFRLTPESPEPSAFDFASPRGKHFVAGMPGDLSFSVVTMWNGAPGSVRFNVAGTWYTATLTSLGAGMARADLSVAVPATVSVCREVTIEVVNGEGKKTTMSAGVYLYPVPPILQSWYPSWAPSGAPLDYSYEEAWDILPEKLGNMSEKFSLSASAALRRQLAFDPLRGEFEGSLGGSGTFGMELDLDKVEALGEARLDVSGSLGIALAGYNPPNITPGWAISLSGKAGVGAPVIAAIDAIFPPAAPATAAALKVPVVGDLLKALKLRVYLILGGELSGEYENSQFGDCFLGTTSIAGSVTLGLEGQVLVEVKKKWFKASAGVYAGVTGTPEWQFCPQIEFEGVTLRGYVGVFASAWSYQVSKEVGVSLRWESPDRQQVIAIASMPESSPAVWEPIGDSYVRWGRTNLLVEERAEGRVQILSVRGATFQETKLVENVVPLGAPAIVSRPAEKLILFSLHDPNKPWWAATDIGTVRQAAGQAWTLDRIANDQAAEFGPSMLATDSGPTLAAWERVAGDTSDANDPSQMAPHMEIVAAWFDSATGAWSTPQQLTSNAVADHQPTPIALGATRGVLWITDEGDTAAGDANPASRLMFAAWSGSAWGTPSALWSPGKSILDYAFVTDRLGEGHVVLAVDEDGDPNTTADNELYLLSTVKGVWQAATQLTSDFVEDALPTLVTPKGVPLCVWNADGKLVYSLLDDWNPRPVYREHTAANQASSLDAVTMPGGAALAYTVQGPNGVDIVASFYDADLDCWSLPRPLTNDEHAESALSLTCDANELVIAYLKTQTERTGVDVEIEGQILHLENVPQPGRTDLYVLRHALTNDLAVVPESLTLDPANPAPGAAATIRATIENRGDLPLSDVAAIFYDGDPAKGGVAIGARQVISGTLIAGGRQNVSVSWKVPQKQNSHEVFVVVDPNLAVEDRDRSNNTLSARTVLSDLSIATCWSTEVSRTAMAVTARVVNTGVIPAGACVVSWRLGAADGAEIGTSTIPLLIVGGAYEATFTWDTAAHLTGDQSAQVFAVVDAAQAVAELDETNNVSSLAVFHPPATSPGTP